MRGTKISLCILVAAALVACPAVAQQAAGATQKSAAQPAKTEQKAASQPAKADQKAGTKSVSAWKETLDLAADGSAGVTIDITLANWDSDSANLPIAYDKPEGISVTCADLVATGQIGKVGDARALMLKFDKKPAAEEKLKIAFTVKEYINWAKARSSRGFYNFSYSFANLLPSNIGAYSLKVLLPPNYKMTQVLSSTPKATGDEAVPPYDFTTEGGRVTVSLRAPSVAVGKSTAITFNFQSSVTNALAYIIVSVIVAAIALWVKRDVLTKEDYTREVSA